MVSKTTFVDGIIYLLICMLSCFLIANFNYTRKDPLVLFSFAVMGIYFLSSIIFCKKNISLKRLFYIFNYVFMFLAPLNQYCSGIVLWRGNGLGVEYTDYDYLYINILILLFCMIFDIIYNYKKPAKQNWLNVVSQKQGSYKAFLIIDLISVVVFTFLLLSHNIFGLESADTQNSNLGTQLVYIMKGIPIGVLSYQIIYWHKNIKHKKLLITIPIVEILIIYFPFFGTVSRFLLFGAYLTIISLLFANAKHKSFFPLLFVLGFGFVFSAFNFFKNHGLYEVTSFSLNAVNFNHVDYDAYQLFMATVYYTKHYGICYGHNILSVIFGFIPRSIWVGKALPSGEIVIGTLGSWFTNVSCPWIAEWYFAFSFLGIVLGAVVSGVLFKMIDSYFDGDHSPLMRGIFAILTGFSIYILRGSLLPTWNYTFAIILAFIAIHIVYKITIRTSLKI